MAKNIHGFTLFYPDGLVFAWQEAVVICEWKPVEPTEPSYAFGETENERLGQQPWRIYWMYPISLWTRQIYLAKAQLVMLVG